MYIDTTVIQEVDDLSDEMLYAADFAFLLGSFVGLLVIFFPITFRFLSLRSFFFKVSIWTLQMFPYSVRNFS